MTRTILHVDMDAFYAAIEQLDHPELRGRPVLVGHDGPRGVVTTASYEARPFGCHSAQPMAVAKRLCPQAVVVPVRFARYHEVSAQVFDILDDFTPIIEPLSVDEAFLDVTGSVRLLGDGPTIARQIRQRIRDELHLTGLFGEEGGRYHRLSHGLDDRPVVPDSEAKGIGHEQTFGADLVDPEQVRAVLLDHVEQVAWRLRKHELRARSIHLKIRDGTFRTITRAKTLHEPTNSTKTLWEESRALFDRWAAASFKPLRLIGMSTSQLTRQPEQPALFPDDAAEQQKRIDAAIDQITAKFGRRSIHRGRADLD